MPLPRQLPPPLLGSSQESFNPPIDGKLDYEAPSPQIATQGVPSLKPLNTKTKKNSSFSFFTLLLMVIMGGAFAAYSYQERIVTYYQNAGVLPSDMLPPTGEQEIAPPLEAPIADPPTSLDPRVEIGGPISEEAILASLGAPNMKINYTRDATYNCGLVNADKAKLDLYVSGCYSLEYENTITIYYGSETEYDMRYFVLLHEYGHYQQGQEGILSSPFYVVSDAEADADCRSLNMGATSEKISCTIEGWTPTWLKTKYAIE